MSITPIKLFIIYRRFNWLNMKRKINAIKAKVKNKVFGPIVSVTETSPFSGTYSPSDVTYHFEYVSMFAERSGRFKFRKVIYLNNLRCITVTSDIEPFLTTKQTDPAAAFAELVYKTCQFRKSVDQLESILSRIEKGNKT